MSKLFESNYIKFLISINGVIVIKEKEGQPQAGIKLHGLHG